MNTSKSMNSFRPNASALNPFVSPPSNNYDHSFTGPQRPEIGDIGHSRIVTPKYHEELSQSRRIERQILDEKRQKENQNKGVFSKYDNKTRNGGQQDEEFFLGNDNDLSLIDARVKVQKDKETGEYIQKFGDSDEDSEVFDKALGVLPPAQNYHREEVQYNAMPNEHQNNRLMPPSPSNKYTPGNNKFKFRMSPKVNPASTKRMIERMA